MVCYSIICYFVFFNFVFDNVENLKKKFIIINKFNLYCLYFVCIKFLMNNFYLVLIIF